MNTDEKRKLVEWGKKKGLIHSNPDQVREPIKTLTESASLQSDWIVKGYIPIVEITEILCHVLDLIPEGRLMQNPSTNEDYENLGQWYFREDVLSLLNKLNAMSSGRNQ